MQPSNVPFKTAIAVAAALLLQGCAQFKTCENVLSNGHYMASDNHKAVAMYFDRSSSQPPRKASEQTYECWYETDSESTQEAVQEVLASCNEGLGVEGKADAWECRIVAVGDELTAEEIERRRLWMENHPRSTGRVASLNMNAPATRSKTRSAPKLSKTAGKN